MNARARVAVILLIAFGLVGGFLIGFSDEGSAGRTVGFLLVMAFFVCGLGMNVATIRRNIKRPGGGRNW
jgi:hypothetical protein